MTDTAAEPTGQDNTTARLETFSDGVIAIAITLLVLEIHIPGRDEVGGSSDLWNAMGDLWPSYLGYLTSFVIIGILWANHHNIFRLIGRTDHWLVMLNTVFLLCIGFLPFTTGLLAEHLTHDGERVATIVYSGWFLLTALSFNLLWWYPSRKGHLIAATADPAAVAEVTRRFNYGPPAYTLAFVLAWIWPPASIGLLILLALLYVLPSKAAG